MIASADELPRRRILTMSFSFDVSLGSHQNSVPILPANRIAPSQSNGRMSESDSVAVARVLRGEPDAYRMLVERHSRFLFRVAFRITGNVSDAEDVVQEAFLRAF